MPFTNGSERSSIILQLHISCSMQVIGGRTCGGFFANNQFLSFYKFIKHEKRVDLLWWVFSYT